MPSPTPLRAAALTAGVVVALSAGSCAPGDDDENPPPSTGPAATEPAEPADPTISRYVALGDSFAAFGPTDVPTSGPEGCLRSVADYPAVVADLTGAHTVVDVTCGGARTVDMTAPQIAATAPQFDALTPDTDLVTVSIGGNDIGFGDIVRCVATTPSAPDRGGPAAAPCRDRLGTGVAAALDGLGARLDAVHAGIRDRAPRARVVVTGYLPLVPAEGGCDFTDTFAAGDLEWTRDVTDRVNRVVAAAAQRAGVPMAMPADADSRHACAPADRRYTDFTGAETGSHPMHPTAAGQRAVGAAVAGLL